MGRYLPWRDGPADGSRPKKRIKAEPSIDDLRAKESKGKDEEIVPEDEYMRAGIKNDDQYIMVEDELLQIAKSYTAKLHSAELARLQTQIALRKSQKLAASQQRIPGSMPKKRQVVLQRRAHDAAIRKAAGIQTDKGAEGESYNPKFSSQSLGRLMTTSAVRIDSALPLPLTPGKAIKPATRAAAGFTSASFKKTTSSQISPSQIRSSQIVEEEYSDIYGRESYDDDDEDLDLIPRRSNSIRVPSKQTLIEIPTNLYASDKRIPPSKQRLRSTNDSRLPSSGPQCFQKPSLLSSSPPPQPFRTFTLSSIPKKIPIPDSDSDNDYADAEQTARWHRRSLPKPLPTSPSAVKPIPTPSSISKPKPALPNFSDDDDDDYADAEQAARFRRRKQLAEAQRSGGAKGYNSLLDAFSPGPRFI